MRNFFAFAGMVILSIQIVACYQKDQEKRSGPGDLGPISDRYAADQKESQWNHEDLNGTWATEINGQIVHITINFDKGIYSSNVPGTSDLKLSLIREAGLEVVFELETKDGSVTEQINCVFKDKNTISMIGNTGVPQLFTRVE